MNPVDNRQAQSRYDDALALIRLKFRQGLADRVLMLKGLIAEIGSDGPTEPGFLAIAAHCHKISGTASTLGFQFMGELARDLEIVLRSASHAGNMEQTWQDIQKPMEVFLRSVEDATSTAPCGQNGATRKPYP